MSADRLVFWGMVVVVIGIWVAAALGYLGTGLMPMAIATAVTLGAAFVGAVQFDRGKRRVDASRYFDENSPNFYAPMGNKTWQVPTAYIDHRTGTGPPPGVESYDEERVERDLETSETGPREESGRTGA